MDPSFAAFYAAHVMRAAREMETEEMRAVRLYRLHRDEERRQRFCSWIWESGLFLMHALVTILNFASVLFGFLLCLVFFHMSLGPYLVLVCDYAATPLHEKMTCTARQLRINNSMIIPAEIFHEINVGLYFIANFFNETFPWFGSACKQIKAIHG